MKKIIDILLEHNINGHEVLGGTDKATTHSYDIVYDEIFNEYRNKKITVLEIGIQYGGSALLWHEFFPESQLVLLDIEDNVPEMIWNKMGSNRYEYILMDAFGNQSVNQLKIKYPEGFDVIVEDGPHTLESQIFAVQNYTPLLKDGGILVIEDIQNYEDCQTIMNSIKQIEYKSIDLIDVRHVKGRYDDLLIVVKK